MTGSELIRALADDLEITQSRAEDMLAALKDFCIAEILAGKNFTFPGIGSLGRVKEGGGPRFDIVPELRQRLGLRARIEEALCATCQKKPRLPRRRQCGTCRSRAYRAAKKKKR